MIAVNDGQPDHMIKMLESKVKDLSDKRVLILGLSFKPETDDVRESVSLKLLDLLSDKVLSLTAHDPIAIKNSKKLIKKGKKKIIPTLQYYTFPNSKSFGGLSIQDKVTDFDISDMRHASMEEYAKLVCILFCPFTTLDCIKKDGST